MAFKQTPGLIADAFSGSFRQKLAEVQEQEQFNRKMYEEQRQQGLIEYWRQQNFKADEAYRQTQLENQKIDNGRQQNAVDKQIANMDADNKLQLEKFEWDKKQDKIRNKIALQNAIPEPENQSPGDFSKGFGLLGKAFDSYQGYNKALKVDDKFQVPTDEGSATFNSQELEYMKKKQMGDVINQSNTLVKEISANYPDFERLFNNAFQEIKSKDQINGYVDSIQDSKGKKLPQHLQDWLKEILKKRIF